MTAEVLGLEYEFKVRQTRQLLKMTIKVFNLIFILGGGPHGWRSYETGVLGNESNAQCPNHQGMYKGENKIRDLFKVKLYTIRSKSKKMRERKMSV